MSTVTLLLLLARVLDGRNTGLPKVMDGEFRYSVFVTNFGDHKSKCLGTDSHSFKMLSRWESQEAEYYCLIRTDGNLDKILGLPAPGAYSIPGLHAEVAHSHLVAMSHD
jgi:hypothetical protein